MTHAVVAVAAACALPKHDSVIAAVADIKGTVEEMLSKTTIVNTMGIWFATLVNEDEGAPATIEQEPAAQYLAMPAGYSNPAPPRSGRAATAAEAAPETAAAGGSPSKTAHVSKRSVPANGSSATRTKRRRVGGAAS